MYNKFLIVASKKDPAGVNITTQLSQFRKNPVIPDAKKDGKEFDFYLVEEEIIYTENLNMEKIGKYDFVIFASKHSSSGEEKRKSLTIHSPGNFRNAQFGGEKGKVCKTSAMFHKQLFEKLNETAKKHDLRNYGITLEVTHHGPLIDKPCLFIEIGPTETEWKNRRVGFIMAETIYETIFGFKENPYNEVAIAIGGPHYCPNFNKIQENSNLAISHIIPQYNFPLTEEMVKEAVEKTEEEIDLAVLDWKGLGNSEQRNEILKILDRLYIRYEKTSDVGKSN